MLTSPKTVFTFVTHIRQSRDWYAKLLGYGPRYVDDCFALFDVGATRLCFHLADAKSPVTTGGSVTYWWTENFDEAVAHAQNMGGQLYRGPIPHEPGTQICQIADPFGNVFGLEGPLTP